MTPDMRISPGAAVGKLDRIVRVDDFGRRLQQFEHPSPGGGRPGKFGKEPAGDPEREVEDHHELGEGHELTEPELAVDDE